MSASVVNLGLLAAAPALVMTGLLAWAFPGVTGEWLLTAHRVIGATVLLALAWKEGIARRSISRRLGTSRIASTWIGALASVTFLLTLGLGVAWTVGLVSFDRPLGYSLLNVHVIAGVILLPLLLAHAAQRASLVRGRAVVSDRRDMFRWVAFGAGAIVLA